MATLTVQDLAAAGLVPAFAAANSADDFVDKGGERTFLFVKNGGGGSINVTVTAVETTRNVGGIGVVTIANLVVAVGAGAEKMIGPFSAAFLDGSQKVSVAYSGTTSVTAGAFRVPDISRGV